MSWRFGIPDFIGIYTYFKDLDNTEQNIPPAAIRKKALYSLATANASSAASELQAPKNIVKANNFLAKVAESERQKEIAAIKSFCESTGKQFPTLQPYLNSPQQIYNNPDDFYIALTAALNEARRGTQEYINELNRIKRNLQEKGRTLENYKAEDYRYRLTGDISSFLNRLRGQYNVITKDSNDDSKYSLKIQNITMRVLEKGGLISRLSSGEDFAAIASALLIQIEQEVQKEIDNISQITNERDISKISDVALDAIEKKYLAIANKSAAAVTPVQRAITDISSIEFARITQNAKELLGLKTTNLDRTSDSFKKLKDRVRKRDSRTKKSNVDISEIRERIKNNRELNSNLMLTSFNISGTQYTKHGTTYELVESLLNGGVNIRGRGATDIMTFTINWQKQTEDAAMNSLLSKISEEITSAVTQQQVYDDSTLQDTKTIIADMNNEITHLIEQAELQLKEMKQYQLDNIFIFHETLKLYSSAETGNSSHAGFGGRNMSILSYIDNLYTMNMAFPIDITSMKFLALNLMGGAVADTYKEPLEKYLSLYAGLIMFDDLANMSEEAFSQIDKTQSTGHIIQIHLYNLNGIYVPASMFLTYISDSVQQLSQFADNGLIATATITTPNSSSGDYKGGNQTYDNWTEGDHHLNPAIWEKVAVDTASHTKINITFLAAFKAFIEAL